MKISLLDFKPLPIIQSRRLSVSIGLIMLVALLIRLVFVLLIDPSPNMAGGDSKWYLVTGRELLEDKLTSVVPVGPTYILYVGVLQKLGGEAAVRIIRLLNCVMGAAMCGFVYQIGQRYFNRRTGLLAALVIAVNPMFIIEAGAVLTESVFLFLLLGALALYAAKQDALSWKIVAAIGVILGLAALTRPVALAFPLILIFHLLYRFRRGALRLCLVLGLTYVLTVATWTVYNLVKFNRFIVGADGLIANIYLGTTDQGWCGAICVDEQAGITQSGNNQSQYVEKMLANLGNSLGRYVVLRLSNLTASLLQPHNTPYYPGASIKQLAAEWWASGHLISGIPTLLSSDNFWPKLALYVFHFGALGLGLIGMVVSIRQFGTRLPVYGIVGYFLAVHFVLTAIPRYLFPAEPGWILFGAWVIAERLTARSRVTTPTLAQASHT
jgi:4-amino-4-deoxy-L-arabinose transferase-like glycosyltransferase